MSDSLALKQTTFTTMALHMMGRLGTTDRGKAKKSEGFFFNEKGEKIYGPRYRGRIRTKCPVGILISDRAYSEDLEGKDCTHPLVQAAIGEDYCKEPDFLLAMQVIHDFHDERHWPNKLFLYAEIKGLKFPNELLPLVNLKD
jgi:hypothetical protein